jgi:hypothetical protein
MTQSDSSKTSSGTTYDTSSGTASGTSYDTSSGTASGTSYGTSYNLSPESGKTIEAEFANMKIAMGQCQTAIVDTVNADNGASFVSNVIKPVYEKLKSKLCTPTDIKLFAINFIEIPDRIDNIEKKTNDISSRLGDMTKHIDDVAKHIDDMAKHIDDMTKYHDIVNSEGDESNKGYSLEFTLIFLILSIILLCFCGLCFMTYKLDTKKASNG